MPGGQARRRWAGRPGGGRAPTARWPRPPGASAPPDGARPRPRTTPPRTPGPARPARRWRAPTPAVPGPRSGRRAWPPPPGAHGSRRPRPARPGAGPGRPPPRPAWSGTSGRPPPRRPRDRGSGPGPPRSWSRRSVRPARGPGRTPRRGRSGRRRPGPRRFPVRPRRPAGPGPGTAGPCRSRSSGRGPPAGTGTPPVPSGRRPSPPRTPGSAGAGAAGASSILPEPVAHAPHGLDRRTSERPVDLLAQVPHVHLEDVPVPPEREVPRVLHQRGPRDGLAGAAHQLLEQRELLRGQRGRGVAPADLVGGRIEHEVAHREDRGPLRRRPPDQRPEPGVELGERERLREVVVRARVEPPHPVVHAVARGEDQDRSPPPVAPEPVHHLHTVAVGQSQVEDHGVVVVLERERRSLGTGGRHVHRVALLAEAPRQQAGHPRMVLDHQGTHGLRPDYAAVTRGTEPGRARPSPGRRWRTPRSPARSPSHRPCGR